MLVYCRVVLPSKRKKMKSEKFSPKPEREESHFPSLVCFKLSFSGDEMMFHPSFSHSYHYHSTNLSGVHAFCQHRGKSRHGDTLFGMDSLVYFHVFLNGWPHRGEFRDGIRRDLSPIET